jgi:hypothetical protein
MMKTRQFVLLFVIFVLSWHSLGQDRSAADALKPKPDPETSLSAPSPGGELQFPIRAAFYYPWFPQAWDQNNLRPFTKYYPTLGYYNEDNLQVIQEHIAAMRYGKIQAGIVSWWGQKHYTDSHIPVLLQAGEKSNFFWALYIESEGYGNPSASTIRTDLRYIHDHYANSPAYLKLGGRFVVFVYGDPGDNCLMADRWKQANTLGAYVVLKVFPDYQGCASQPDGWHQYAPAMPQDQQGKISFTISPGFWKADKSKPALKRDIERWSKSIQAMIDSGTNFQLITTYNEWGEGTAVESAQQWASPTGYGLYLDALHYDGNLQKMCNPIYALLPFINEMSRGNLFSGVRGISDCGFPLL